MAGVIHVFLIILGVAALLGVGLVAWLHWLLANPDPVRPRLKGSK